MVSLSAERGKRAGSLLAALLPLAFVLAIGATTARAQCGVVGTNVINWNDDSGNWSLGTNWDLGCAPANGGGYFYDVVINSPGNVVTLDSTSSPSSVTVDTLSLVGGTLDIASGASLNLANQANGITDIALGAGLTVAGTFTTGGSTSALAQLNSVEGALTLVGQTTGVTPGSGTLTNSGDIYVQGTSALSVTGSVTNSGLLETGADGSSNNAVSVSGTLTNTGSIYMKGDGDSLSADLTNAGLITLQNNNQTLTDTGDLINSFAVYLNANNDSVSVAGAVNNTGWIVIYGVGNGGGGNKLTAGSWSNLDGSGNLTGGAYNIGGLFQYGSPSNGIINIASGADVVLQPGGLITPDGTTDALAGLASNAGVLQLVDYPETFTPASGTFSNSNWLFLYNDSGSTTTLTVNGNFDNSNHTQFYGPAATALNVTGNSTNEGTIQMLGPGDSFSTTGTLTNTGSIYMHGVGDSLSADLTNAGSIVLYNDNQTLTDTGDLINSFAVYLQANNDSVSVAGAVNNTGWIVIYGTHSGGSDNKLTAGSWSNLDGSGNLTGGAYNLGGLFQYGSPSNGIINIASGADVVLQPGGLITPDGTTDALAGLASNAGTLFLADYPESFTPTSGTFSNSGSLYLYNDSGSATLTVNGNFDNSGNTFVYGTGQSLSAAGVTNSGSVSIAAGNSVSLTNNYTQSGGTTVVDGTMTVLNAMINGGLLEGSGMVTGNVTLAPGATLHPGDSPGIMMVSGNYTPSGGNTQIDIAGGAVGTGYSQLQVGGTATLTGTLELNLLGGFTPTDGEMFVILTASTVNGTFATIDGQIFSGGSFDIFYNATNVTIEAILTGPTPVPEPGTLLLLGTGLAGLLASRRRKKN